MGKNVPGNKIKILLLVASLLAIPLMLISAFEENLSGDWRDHQKAYRTLLKERAANEKAREAAEGYEIRLRQVVLTDLGRMDRCVTCHAGVDNPQMADAALPMRAHSGTFLKDHPLETFGCTVCHDGQGRAVEKEAAHGDVKHWPEPRLAGPSAYTTCGRCHYENDLYGAETDLFYTEDVSPAPIARNELESAVPGNDSIRQGKRLVLKMGCLGCHKYRGRGGVLGPDITYVGDKIAHDFDFTHIRGEHTVSQWLYEHFKDPQAVSPDTLMPQLELSPEETLALTDYMLSLHRKTMPVNYTPAPPVRSGEPAGGKDLYRMYCSSCHGEYGQGSTVRDPLEVRAVDRPLELMVPSLNHPDTLSVASNDFLNYIIRNGRPATTMMAWQAPRKAEGGGGGPGGENGGLRPEEVERLVRHIRSWQPPLPDVSAVEASRGEARYGRLLYQANCAACHGTAGAGGIGPSLNAPSFQGIASDAFLSESIVRGRPNTAMPGWRQFDSLQLSDLLSTMRSWHGVRSERGRTLKLAAARRNSLEASASIGRTLYQANCTMCHGPRGEGDLGPSLATQEFLALADNGYLYETLSEGRPGTGMPAWRRMSSADVASLIRFIRTWQTVPARNLPDQPLHGDWDTGKILFQGMCAGCHGTHAEGGVGPQLNNPVFLKTANDAMLYRWIAYGKTGTPMRSFIKGAQGAAELSGRQIEDIVSHVRSMERDRRVWAMKSPSGRPELGRIWYAMVCTSCHGTRGEGASGPSLANPEFLHAASDGFLMATLARGRDGTEMRPLKKSPQSIVSLSSDQINDVVAFLRFWETEPPQAGIPHRFEIPWDLGHGREVYESNCSGCHGMQGRAEKEDARMSSWAPELNNEGFLAAATDGFLQATIVKGRMGTAMRPFGKGLQGLVDFSSGDIDDVVAHIRRWSTHTGGPMTRPAEVSLTVARDLKPEDAVPEKE